MEPALIADKDDVIERTSKGCEIGRWFQDDLEFMYRSMVPTLPVVP